MKRGDSVEVRPNGPFDARRGTVVAGPKPTKRGEDYWDIDCGDGFVWSYPESRLSVVGGGDSEWEAPAAHPEPDDEWMDMEYERQKDAALEEGVHYDALD